MTALDVLHADNHLLAVAKPAGVPSVPDESGDESALERAVEWVRVEYAKPGAAFLAVVHRLDRPVSGVLLFARTSKAAARLSEQFRSARARKTYWAVTEGAPAAEEGELVQWLWKDAGARRVRVRDEGTPGARRAVTRWRVRARRHTPEGERAWVELWPATGRPHQLRVALASLGAPLAGDRKYGARAALPDRSIALHARSLEVEHPTRAETCRLSCPPPAARWWDWVRSR